MNHDYGKGERPEILRFIPAGTRSLLDVGCAGGGFGAALKKQYPSMRIEGVEQSIEPASRAQRLLDEVHVGTFQDVLDSSNARNSFDCITFLDSLEHMVDPWDALRHAMRMLNHGGVIVVSLPNVRHIEVSGRLMFQGRFDYMDYGVLDRTHLRFFTLGSAKRMFDEVGLAIYDFDRLEWSIGSKWFTLARMLGRLGRDLRTMQYVFACRASS